MPWVSNEPSTGLAYCVGGKSLFWGGWSARLTAADLALWPGAVRDALAGLGIGSTQFGSPRAGNLMAHLRSNIVVRIHRAALGLPAAPAGVELSALLVRGEALNRRFHIQVTAAPTVGPDSEANMWQMVPDIGDLAAIEQNLDQAWVVVTLRGIAEMEDDRAVLPNPARSWIDLSQESDQWGQRRAYVHLVATQADRDLWTRMDDATFALAARMAGNAADIEYWNAPLGLWQALPPQGAAFPFWRDPLGSTHHEAGTLFMGAAGAAVTDEVGRFHGIANAYAAGPALYPTVGSANPSLTGIALAHLTAAAIA
jgi:choline dehydrogenase-like flavoprotein